MTNASPNASARSSAPAVSSIARPSTSSATPFVPLRGDPGANESGSNFISLQDAIYVMFPGKCIVLDPEDGSIIKEFELPPIDEFENPKWGNIKIIDDKLVVCAVPVSVLIKDCCKAFSLSPFPAECAVNQALARKRQ